MDREEKRQTLPQTRYCGETHRVTEVTEKTNGHQSAGNRRSITQSRTFSEENQGEQNLAEDHRMQIDPLVPAEWYSPATV